MEPKRGTERYVVVGYGWVGQANALALRMLGKEVASFDLATPEHHYAEHAVVYDAIPALSDAREWDSATTWYLVCVGDRVAESGEQDLSSIKSALESLRGVAGKVVLRSTVIPDSLEELPFDCYVPEFLHEKYAVAESLAPHLFVIGKRDYHLEEPSLFALWRSRATRVFKGTPREAAMVKYLSNLWNALQIAFVNEFGDAIATPASKEEVARIEQVIDFIFEGKAYRRYGRAFGGHCLPKDTRAFLKWSRERNVSVPLIAGMYESNEQHRKRQDAYPLLKEWFSAWTGAHTSGRKALKELAYAVKKHIVHPELILRIFSMPRT
jgi:UDP-glucose 6-dehydrogenase